RIEADSAQAALDCFSIAAMERVDRGELEICSERFGSDCQGSDVVGDGFRITTFIQFIPEFVVGPEVVWIFLLDAAAEIASVAARRGDPGAELNEHRYRLLGNSDGAGKAVQRIKVGPRRGTAHVVAPIGIRVRQACYFQNPAASLCLARAHR